MACVANDIRKRRWQSTTAVVQTQNQTGEAGALRDTRSGCGLLRQTSGFTFLGFIF
jgi:hypothetical protein